MSIYIETLDELRSLVRKLGIKVESIAELRELIAAVNAQSNPDMARLKTLKVIGVVAAVVPPGAAALATMLLFAESAKTGGVTWGGLLALAIVWPAVALISTLAVYFTFRALRQPASVAFSGWGSKAGLGGASTGPQSPGGAPRANDSMGDPNTQVTKPAEPSPAGGPS
jgi:hypothetical protein